jgi:hypothetical protein
MPLPASSSDMKPAFSSSDGATKQGWLRAEVDARHVIEYQHIPGRSGFRV